MTDTGQRGVALIILSAIAFSTAGFFTRLIPLDVWTVLFWRGLFGGLFIAGFIVGFHRRGTLAAVRAVGWGGLLMAGCATVATICFVHALRRTTVADVSVIYGVAPFATALMAWIACAERPSRTTLAASAVAFAGVAAMTGAGLAQGQLTGDLLALAMTLLTSVVVVLVRARRQTPMLPAACLSALACAAVVLPVAHPGAATAGEIGDLVLFGIAQFGLGLLLLTLGTRLIPAARSALIGNLELPLGPVWVWLAFGELPTWATCVGGAVVAAAVAGDMLLGRRHRLA